VNVIVASRDRDFRDQITQILQDHSHRVVSTDQSSQLIDQILKDSFDLIVTDVDLSGMDGVESLPILRRLRPKVPIVMVSEELPPQRSQQIAREGAFYHFHKPLYDYDFLQVVEAIAKRLPTPKAQC